MKKEMMDCLMFGRLSEFKNLLLILVNLVILIKSFGVVVEFKVSWDEFKRDYNKRCWRY